MLDPGCTPTCKLNALLHQLLWPRPEERLSPNARFHVPSRDAAIMFITFRKP